MASSSGTSSGSTTLTQNSGSSEKDLKALMEEIKRKRKVSKRESARRSRMRKRKHLDDLTATVARLQKQNHEIVTTINFSAQRLLNVEAENSVLRAQLGELSHRLECLNEIVGLLNDGDDHNGNARVDNSDEAAVDSLLNPLNLSYLNQPIMASADNMFQF